MSPTLTDHHGPCIRCGLAAPTVKFRTPRAKLCTSCVTLSKEERGVYGARYDRARARATRRLVAKHQAEYRRFFAQERLKQDREEERQSA